MPDPIKVKICGVTRPDDIAAVADAGGAYVGFNFFPKSPRYLTPAQARALALSAPAALCKVGLVVDGTDAIFDALMATVPLDMLQLHGRETPERVKQVKARYGLPVIKAVGVATANDLPALERYGGVADQLLVDAKPPKGATLPGGNGAPFDWSLIAGREWPVPWMLAGGLRVENLGAALAATGARQVDLASAVERAPGVKDRALIRAFCAEALSH
ncbi:MAG: phosphoribosylanthranilate isomerase [Pseudomonadota bacterium]